MMALRLARPMSSPAAPEWSGAVWIGTVDTAELAGLAGSAIELEGPRATRSPACSCAGAVPCSASSSCQ
ncbi:hypothetical protein [Frondihabitans sp. PAMC 28766]|uniref:hypothetical protein n=1 Tax=Frondihabitans sp. PAMC 28766 TaxID=1795630 RepID=UPI0012FFA5B8|nr:hypothetical protein [Frondihabitans sp. PAMC 28766]